MDEQAIEQPKKDRKEYIDPTTGRFIPGNPGGPGRPKGSFSIVEMIKAKLKEKPEGKEKTYAEYFVEQVMKKAVIEGDVVMMKDIIDRLDGKPYQRIGSIPGEEMKFNIIHYGGNHDPIPIRAEDISGALPEGDGRGEEAGDPGLA